MSCVFVGHELMFYKRKSISPLKKFLFKGQKLELQGTFSENFNTEFNNNKIIEYFIFLDEIKELEKYFQINSEMYEFSSALFEREALKKFS